MQQDAKQAEKQLNGASNAAEEREPDSIPGVSDTEAASSNNEIDDEFRVWRCEAD